MAAGGWAARREDILVTRMRWAGLGQGGDCGEEEHEWGLRGYRCWNQPMGLDVAKERKKQVAELGGAWIKAWFG